MKNAKAVLSEVLKEIEPDEKYQKEMFKRINEIIIKINRGLKDAKAVLGGSGAKGTWLKTFDADIFVLFDYRKYNNRSQVLSDIFSDACTIHFIKDKKKYCQGIVDQEIAACERVNKGYG